MAIENIRRKRKPGENVASKRRRRESIWNRKYHAILWNKNGIINMQANLLKAIETVKGAAEWEEKRREKYQLAKLNNEIRNISNGITAAKMENQQRNGEEKCRRKSKWSLNNRRWHRRNISCRKKWKYRNVMEAKEERAMAGKTRRLGCISAAKKRN